MPHSVSPESEALPDASMADPTTAQPNDSGSPEEESTTLDDITMAEPDALPDDDDAASGANDASEARDNKDTKDAHPEVKLEDLFADVDSDDDEFPSSRPAPPKDEDADSSPPPSSPIAPLPPAALRASDPEVMRTFYQRLFPWRHLFQWLNHAAAPTPAFAHREFAFTLPNDAYLRYQSFASADALRRDVLRLLPSRFEVGPEYSANPRDRKTLRNATSFRPLAKELCFDIDLTDYDEVRTCCAKAEICGRCWQFITMAVKVVDVALREDFGFRHILWVYSGRRGAHAWVCDKKARAMDDQKRRAVAGYLEVVRGGAQGGKKVNVRRPLHPHLSRSLDLLAPHFQADILGAQDPWSTPELAERLLALLPDAKLNDALRAKWASSPSRSSAQKWADIDAVAKSGASKGLDAKGLRDAKQDVVLEYTYPRLDIEVSKKLNHLLKSPFVVHPGTGRVCVPIDTSRLEAFDPLGVPTVQTLLAEIDAWRDDDEGDGVKSEEGEDGDKGKKGEEREGKRKLQDWEKTGLRPYVEYFRAFVAGLLRDERDDPKVKREREEGEGMEF